MPIDTAGGFTFTLTDESNLRASDYKLYVLGFSVASELLLSRPQDGGETGPIGWAPPPAGVTITAALTQSVQTIVLTSLPPFGDIMVGDQVSGAGISAATTVAGVSVMVSLTNPLAGPVSGPVQVSTTTLVGGSATAGSSTITGLVPPPAISGLRIGQIVSGQNIPSGAIITSARSISFNCPNRSPPTRRTRTTIHSPAR